MVKLKETYYSQVRIPVTIKAVLKTHGEEEEDVVEEGAIGVEAVEDSTHKINLKRRKIDLMLYDSDVIRLVTLLRFARKESRNFKK